MKTPDEIKKGLECCAKGNSCRGKCPYDGRSSGIKECTSRLSRDATAYIQQLEEALDMSFAVVKAVNKDANEQEEQLTAQVPRWISVEERLPEESVKVLVFDALNQQERVMYAHDDGGWWDERDRFYSNVEDGDITHWMPLPEPPKEVQHE